MVNYINVRNMLSRSFKQIKRVNLRVGPFDIENLKVINYVCISILYVISKNCLTLKPVSPRPILSL